MVKLLLGISVLYGLWISAAAMAGENSGVYIFGAVGQSQLKSVKSDQTALDAQLTAAGATGVSSSTNDNQDAYSLFLGYQFNRKWAIEGGYVDIGTTNYSAQGSAGAVAGTASLSNKYDAASLTAVRTWNVPDNFGNNGFSFLAKFGIARVRSSPSGSVTIPGIVLTSQSDAKNGITFGLGARYDFDQNWAIRADADSYDTGQSVGRLPVYTLGLSYKF